MNVYSFSRLSLYATCPYRFYLKYVLGRQEPVTKPLALGKAVHKGVELRIKGASEEEAVMAAIIESDFHPEVDLEEMERLIRVALMVKGETEVHFVLPLAHGSNLKVQGYIDLLSESAFFDWKTNWRMYGVNDTMQLALYAWAIMQTTGRDIVRGTLYFLRYKKPLSYLYTFQEAEKARQWAYELALEISEKVSVVELFPDMSIQAFQATPGSHCKHCPFALECYRQFKKGEAIP